MNFINIRKSKKDKKVKSKQRKEEEIMKKTLKIEGMMCGHCEARVKKCLEELPQVDEAIVSHETDSAELILNAEISDEALKEIIEAQGYKVLD